MAKVLISSVLFVCVLSFARARSEVTCFSSDSTSGKGKRIYTIAHGHDWRAYYYINKDGIIDGFLLDLIREVCSAVGVDCRTVREPYRNCIKSLAGQHSRAGPGLMDHWYDACAGWLVSTTRMSIFSFSESFAKEAPSSFYVKFSDNSFDPAKYSEFKIGFVDGWVYDEKCLYRLYGQLLPQNRVVHYTTSLDLLNDVTEGKVAAAYMGDDIFGIYTTGSNAKLKRVGNPKHCSVRGYAMMSRKDSDFPAIWNDGFQKIVSSGAFKKLCDQAKTIHNTDVRGSIDCI